MGGDNDNKHEQKLQAVLLADSFLSTFQPITLNPQHPKVLCPLNNITLLDYAIEFLAGAGVQELYVFCVTGGTAVEQYIQQSSWTRSIKVKCVIDSSVTNAGDALRELDKQNLIQSDPFILMTGDVVTNVDIVPALQEHKDRHKKDSSAIMTVLMKQVGGWNFDPSTSTYQTSSIRSMNDDLVVALNSATPAGDRILVYDANPANTNITLPTSFFASNSQIEVRNDMLDTGIYICSPDVLARFSDEFDYLHIAKFISNSVAEEEEGLQSKIYASILKPSEYAARIHDPRTYHAVSRDMLRRWCYPIVPDNLPSGYDKTYRYEMQRHMMYVEQRGKTKVGRSTVLKGPGMLGSESRIGANCRIEQTVIGNNCSIGNNVVIKNSHLWESVLVEDGAEISEAIICNECIIKKGAKVPKGCIIASKCIIGENVELPPFSRITLDKGDDDDDFSGFSSEESDSDEESSNDGDVDHVIVGKDGAGELWKPNYSDFGAFDDDEFDSDDESEAQRRACDFVRAQSIGYDPTEVFKRRMQRQLDEDELSDHEAENEVNEDRDDDYNEFGVDQANLDEDGFLITGRQAGVDVVKELKNICLEHDVSSPIDNLRIELNSFKFSQNASFSDCITGAILAIFERLKLKEDISAAKLVTSFKGELKHWGELLKKFCHSVEEERSIISAIETAAMSEGTVGKILSKEPSFRFILQTLHDEEIVSEEAILSWASMRKSDLDGPQQKLFQQKATQEFLEWLEDDSDSDSGSGSGSGSDSDSE
jgi:translation initiation factor eIF-2B subunit epsilon